jgi:hypothetical protein
MMPPAKECYTEESATPSKAQSSLTSEDVEPGLITCWYCLEERAKGSECCGYLLDCWCTVCKISGELGKACEYCNAVLEVYVY